MVRNLPIIGSVKPLDNMAEDGKTMINRIAGATLSVLIGLSLAGQAAMAQDATSQAVTAQPSVKVHFQDANLEQAIRKQIDKSDDEAILLEDIESLTSIDLSHQGIKNLEGLQFATNLTYLRLFNNDLEDISPLGALTKLRGIDLTANRITSIEALAAMSDMEEMKLSGNLISSVEVVKRFPRLQYFEANHNRISDIQALSTAVHLSMLELGNNQIADFEPISNLPKLTYLGISYNPISDLSVLKPLSDTLQALYTGGNHISDLRVLEGMTQLRTLYAENNQIADVTPLRRMKDLSMLNLRSNRIYDLEPLRSLTKIHNLYLDDNRIWNIEPLQNHSFDTHYDTGALLYGLTLADNYLDLRDTTKSYRLLQKLAGDGHRLNQRKAQRLAIGSATAYVGESGYQLDTAPLLHKNRTYVPVRFVAERLGAQVAWEPGKQEVTIQKGSTTIHWIVNERKAIVDGRAVTFDAPLLLKNQRTLLPVRLAAELLGSSVEYMPSSKTVLIFEGR